MSIKRYLWGELHGNIQNRTKQLLLLVWPILIFLIAILVMEASAQEPQCPSGFFWRRMSGVGCMQEDCVDVGGYYNSIGSCTCPDGMAACTEPVDYSGFNADLCKPFCPGAKVISCVETPDACPSQNETTPPNQNPPDEVIPPIDEPGDVVTPVNVT